MRYRNWQSEPARPSASGVQIQDAVSLVYLRTMRMAVYHRMHACRSRLDIQVIERVHQIELAAAELHRLRRRQLRAWPCDIDVAPDCSHGSQLHQLGQN